MKKQRRPSGSLQRSAFTLVEMLVSVALVLVIMSLFATTFRLASDTVRRVQFCVCIENGS